MQDIVQQLLATEAPKVRVVMWIRTSPNIWTIFNIGEFLNSDNPVYKPMKIAHGKKLAKYVINFLKELQVASEMWNSTHECKITVEEVYE